MKSYSQLGQDLWVYKLFKKKGFFVDIGANDGILSSNTYLLEKKFDWEGVCVEPSSIFKELRKNRNCACVNLCLSDKKKKVRFEEIDGKKVKKKGNCLRSSISNKGKEKWAISLFELLRRIKAPETIDYLSIDTEGHEYEILKNFPFDKYKFRAISLEHNEDLKLRRNLRELLTSKGYVFVKPGFTENGRAIEDLYLHCSEVGASLPLCKKANKRYITHKLGPCGWFGHQAKEMISAIILSKMYNLNYVWHGFAGESKPWERFLNFRRGDLRYEDFLLREDLTHETYRYKKRKNCPKIVFVKGPHIRGLGLEKIKEIFENNENNVLYHLDRCCHVTLEDLKKWEEEYPLIKKNNVYERTMQTLRDLYKRERALRKIPEWKVKGKVNVSMTIRRGDVTEKNSPLYKARYLPNSFYLKIMDKIEKVIGKNNVVFHVFSNGLEKEFKGFKNRKNTKMYLPGHLKYPETFYHFIPLVESDIHITGQSTFSHLAAILSEKIVLTRRMMVDPANNEKLGECFHCLPKTEKTIIMDDKGSFDEKELEKLVKKFILKKKRKS